MPPIALRDRMCVRDFRGVELSVFLDDSFKVSCFFAPNFALVEVEGVIRKMFLGGIGGE